MRPGVFSFQFSVFSPTAAVAGNALKCPRTNRGVSTYHPAKKTRWHLLQIVASAISEAGLNRRWTQMDTDSLGTNGRESQNRTNGHECRDTPERRTVGAEN